MELIDIIPVFNLYEEFWRIYTKSEILPPQYLSADSKVERCIIGEGTAIYGEVKSSVIGTGVVIEKGAYVEDSIIMSGTVIKAGTHVYKSIIAENVVIGENCNIGIGEEAESKLNAKIYAFGLAVIGEDSIIPDGVTIGKNTVITGETTLKDYVDRKLASGGYIRKAGEM